MMEAVRRYLATVCLLLFVAALPDRALSQEPYQAEVNGTTYEFSLTDGDATLDTLQRQFWWGNQALAESAARTVAIGLGTEVYLNGATCLGECSPRFAFSEDVFLTENVVSYVYFNTGIESPTTLTFFDTTASVPSLNYVVARVVGVPEISSSGAAASLATIFALMLLLKEAMMRRKVVSNNA
jgi:hypothetical protein